MASTLEKVRFFRNLLLTDDRVVRVIMGPTGKLHALYDALATLEGLTLNPLCIIDHGNAVPRLVGSAGSREPILVYLRTRHDAFVYALLCEYGSDRCELVVFEAAGL